jgi:hypothetical protein
VALAADIEHQPEPRLDVVVVLTRILAEILESNQAVQAAAAAGSLQDNEVRIGCLVDLITGHDVVAEPEIQGQPGVEAPVVLDVQPELLHRQVRGCVAVAERHGGNRPVQIVRGVRVDDDAPAAVEGREQVRLVDEVHAGLEIVTQAAAVHMPRKIVPELKLVLLRRLRRIAVGAEGDTARKDFVRRRAGRGDLVAEIGVLKDELVQPCT